MRSDDITFPITQRCISCGRHRTKEWEEGSLIKHIVDSIREVSEIVNRPLIAGGIGVDVAAGPSREAGRGEDGSSTNPRRPRTSDSTRAAVNCVAPVVEC